MKGAPKTPDKTTNAHDARSHARGMTRRAASGGLQSACEFGGVQEAAGNLAIQRLFGSGLIQAKLAISQPDDPYEREADRVADRVLSSATVPSIQPSYGNGAAGDSCRECAAEQNVQVKELAGHTPRGSALVESSLGPPHGGRLPLPPAVRAFVRPRLARHSRE